METRELLGVSHADAFEFFLEHLKDVTEEDAPPLRELLYNASVLAHFASTSAASDDYPGCPTSLRAVFDTFVLDRSRAFDADLMEAAAAQCLLLTGFFLDQQRLRHNVHWYAALGSAFYERAAQALTDQARARMMRTMARRFGFWRHQQRRLAHELRESQLPRVASRPF
ncbi:MAG: hypothetical protein IT184_06435 [Acidobacteria bacterium]|nr:hypothetical protein [Acidobacteriota bacterium]